VDDQRARSCRGREYATARGPPGHLQFQDIRYGWHKVYVLHFPIGDDTLRLKWQLDEQGNAQH
jgi:hypothetical protein